MVILCLAYHGGSAPLPAAAGSHTHGSPEEACVPLSLPLSLPFLVYLSVCVSVCVSVCLCASLCVRACSRAYVRVRVCACVCGRDSVCVVYINIPRVRSITGNGKEAWDHAHVENEHS